MTMPAFKARLCGLGSTELCSTIAYEWSADMAALTSDGQHWRSVFGGSRLVGPIRLPPTAFLILRALLLGGVAAVFALDLIHSLDEGYGYSYWLYFEHWTIILQLTYFGLATLLTFYSVCMSDPGAISRSAPFIVRVTELCYGALLPATILNFLANFLVIYAHPVCTPLNDTSKFEAESVSLAAALLGAQLLDLIFNRQPYYQSMSALTGLVFCWSYFLFAALFEILGGTDAFGHGYVYRCLDWSFPIIGGGVYTTGKLLYINLYTAVPLVNLFFWVLLWARRRALVAPRSKSEKGRGSIFGGSTSSLLDQPRVTLSRRVFFEYAADDRDLAHDGRHRRAQFGGSSGRSPKMGAYVCCGPLVFACVRIVLFIVAAGVCAVRFIEFKDQYPSSSLLYIMLYYENWVIVLAATYFLLAAILTTAATCLSGAESVTTPLLVWAVWAAYGALLPSAIIQALTYMIGVLEINGDAPTPGGAHLQPPTTFGGASVWFDLGATLTILVIVLLDAWINRQPYYATFHAFLGVTFNYAYFLFLCLYSALGGTNALGHTFIYGQFDLSTGTIGTVLQPSLLCFTEALLLVPALAAMYWCALWARRRAMIAAKQPGL